MPQCRIFIVKYMAFINTCCK